jgi:hypothetical protein
MSDLAYPIKLDDDYPCRGIDALGETQTFKDLLTEGMEVGPEVDGEVFPTGEVVRRDDGLWCVAEGGSDA